MRRSERRHERTHRTTMERMHRNGKVGSRAVPQRPERDWSAIMQLAGGVLLLIAFWALVVLIALELVAGGI